MSASIASAVVLPEPEEEEPPLAASPPNPHKRRQSSVTEDSAKRPRFEDDDATTAQRESATDSKPAVPARRERGRERRLFGAALGALSQNSATAGQKRRLEIEKRQLAQRKLEDEESEQRKAERMARRRTQRWREQKVFETQAIKARHENLLNMAHFLYTKTEPRLYYKPWETSAEEEDRIQDQIAEARETIRRELEEYEIRQDQESRPERRTSIENGTSSAMDTSGTGKEHSEDAHQPPPIATVNDDRSPQDQDMKDDQATGPPDVAPAESHFPEPMQDTWPPNPEPITEDTSKEDDDNNGEEVVEAAEDTVIY